MARLSGRRFGAREGTRLDTVERGLSALLRLDLHAMVRLLNGQRLTVADIVGDHEPAGSGSRPSKD